MTHPNFDRLNMHAAFPTTTWELIRSAQKLPASQRAEKLSALLNRYWNPIYAFYRSKVWSTDDAEDLVQAFLADFIGNEKILQVTQNGDRRFRGWLKTCLMNYLISQRRREFAQKRAPQERAVSLEQLHELGASIEPRASHRPEAAFDNAWRRDLLGGALAKVRQQCDEENRQTHFQVFCDYYCNIESSESTWKSVAERFQLGDPKIASHMSDWVKAKLHKAIRDEIALYAVTEAEIDEEIQDLRNWTNEGE
jgi:DNA-directed RNA polymerase specialized sigma24 family protein